MAIEFPQVRSITSNVAAPVSAIAAPSKDESRYASSCSAVSSSSEPKQSTGFVESIKNFFTKFGALLWSVITCKCFAKGTQKDVSKSTTSLTDKPKQEESQLASRLTQIIELKESQIAALTKGDEKAYITAFKQLIKMESSQPPADMEDKLCRDELDAFRKEKADCQKVIGSEVAALTAINKVVTVATDPKKGASDVVEAINKTPQKVVKSLGHLAQSHSKDPSGALIQGSVDFTLILQRASLPLNKEDKAQLLEVLNTPFAKIFFGKMQEGQIHFALLPRVNG